MASALADHARGERGASARRDQPSFRYVAVTPTGRRTRGTVQARDEGSAYEQLKRQGLSPTQLKPAPAGSESRPSQGLTDRETGELLSNLAALLEAGANVRSALGVVGGKGTRPAVRAVCQQLLSDIAGGGALEEAFARSLGQSRNHVPAIIAAGEAAGDVAGGLRRASEILESQVRIRDQLISTLSYPSFVLLTSIMAMGVILLFVIPALAPLVQQNGAKAPLVIGVLIVFSDAIRNHGRLLLAGVLATAGALAGLWRAGVIRTALDAVVLDGPFKRTASALVYGGFAISAGAMLTAGTPMSDALKLAIRSVRSPLARGRLEPAAQAIREGRAFSDVIGRIDSFPASIARLAVIGEASGAVGPMMARAGKLEEDAALRRIEAAGRMIGPAVIVALGALIGLLMGGLLSGVTHIGDSALQ